MRAHSALAQLDLLLCEDALQRIVREAVAACFGEPADVVHAVELLVGGNVGSVRDCHEVCPRNGHADHCTSSKYARWPMADVVAKGGIGRLR
eukprot:2281622-Prymnesium_polylepis.1